MTSSGNFFFRRAFEHEAKARAAQDPDVRRECEDLAKAYRAVARHSLAQAKYKSAKPLRAQDVKA
jgi:hypothetical protein